MRNRSPLSLDRREFIGVALATLVGARAGAAEGNTKKFTGAIIGHSGRGDYGHSVDLIFTDRDDVELLAVADPVADGRAKAAARSKSPRQYENWRGMLAKGRPQLVGISPRGADQK